MAALTTDERSPLLPQQKEQDVTFSVWKDLVLLSRRSVPICLSFALQNAVQAISAVIAGSLGSFELAVTSYGFMFFSCTNTMMALGGSTALDTLCSHAFTSDAATENPQRLGLLLQQCLLVLLCMFGFLIVPIWAVSGHIFTALGQEREFAFATGKFMICMIPAGILQITAECLKKFLQVQEASDSVGWITVVASVAGVLATLLLVKCTGLALWGVPTAFAIYQFLMAVLLLWHIFRTPDIKSRWRMSTHGMTKGLSRLLFYAITGIMTTATEWWR